MKHLLYLIAAALLACPQTAEAQHYKNHDNLLDGSHVQVSLSDKQRPATLNGEKIYDRSFLSTAPQFPSRDTTLRQYILTSLVPEFNQLSDGYYNFHLNDIVVDKDGKIVYAKYGGVAPAKKKGNYVPDEVQLQIERRLQQVLTTAPALTPARNNAANVPFVIESLPPVGSIRVKNHVATVY